MRWKAEKQSFPMVYGVGYVRHVSALLFASKGEGVTFWVESAHVSMFQACAVLWRGALHSGRSLLWQRSMLLSNISRQFSFLAYQSAIIFVEATMAGNAHDKKSTLSIVLGLNESCISHINII
jgi:hypothetical protein